MDTSETAGYLRYLIQKNEKTEMYRFRNFVDLVEVFDKKGYRFVDE
jgi:hypothetical protein